MRRTAVNRRKKSKNHRTRKNRGGGFLSSLFSMLSNKNTIEQQTNIVETTQPQEQQQQTQKKKLGWFERDPFAKEKKNLLWSIKYYQKELDDPNNNGAWLIRQANYENKEETKQHQIKTGELYLEFFKLGLEVSNMKYNALFKSDEERKLDYDKANELQREVNMKWQEYAINRRLLSDMWIADKAEQNANKKSSSQNALQSFGRMGFGGKPRRNSTKKSRR